MEPILKEKLNVVSSERYMENDVTKWKIRAKNPEEHTYEIHAEYHDWMLHVHLEETTNPKVITRIEMWGGTKILYIQYMFDHPEENLMEDDEFKNVMDHLLVFN